jgi:hypothetical protein
MPLSPTQLRTAQDWIDQYVGRHCPCCGYTSLHIDSNMMTLLQAPERGGELDPSTATPLLTLTCGVCANMRFFSAKMVGLVTDQRTPVAAKTPRAMT